MFFLINYILFEKLNKHFYKLNNLILCTKNYKILFNIILDYFLLIILIYSIL